MARAEVLIDGTLNHVFELLADPGSYSEWVVGSREIRHADGSWPGPGTRLGHTVGYPPLLIRDETIVVDSEPPVGLTLEARARPLPSARVTFRLEPRDGCTLVTMVEDLANPALNLLAGPFVHALMRVRNRETLRRLKALVEARSDPRPLRVAV